MYGQCGVAIQTHGVSFGGNSANWGFRVDSSRVEHKGACEKEQVPVARGELL